jgi:GT2 family glycosyltransferase
LFDIFIADTGSSDEEKNQIKTHFLDKSNIKLIEYDYYNFAKINNDVVKNHINDDYEFLLFCNNDIKLLNNVVYGMLKIFKTTPKVGTVGCRLHYGDNTIQHDGIFMSVNKNKQLSVGHIGFTNYFNHSIGQKSVIGSTAALLMIRKSTFEKCEYFNENYKTCFEDVELNLKCVILNYDNIIDSTLVAYHLESQTRGKTEINQKNELFDYQNNLFPYVVQNFDKIKTYLMVLQ